MNLTGMNLKIQCQSILSVSIKDPCILVCVEAWQESSNSCLTCIGCLRPMNGFTLDCVANKVSVSIIFASEIWKIYQIMHQNSWLTHSGLIEWNSTLPSNIATWHTPTQSIPRTKSQSSIGSSDTSIEEMKLKGNPCKGNTDTEMITKYKFCQF